MLSTNKIKLQIIEYLKQEIATDSCLKDNIVSIMGIGGLAKNKPEIHDVDLNIFTKSVTSNTLCKIKELLKGITRVTGLDCDVNIVDYEFYKDNICSSMLFI